MDAMSRPVTKTSTVSVAILNGWSDHVVDGLEEAEPEQGQRQRHEHLERVEVHRHPEHLQDVPVGVLAELELRLARALVVVDRQEVNVVVVGQERHGDRGDAGEAGGQQPQVGQRHLAPEGPQARVQVGDLRPGQPLGELPDEPLGRHPEQLVGALLAGPRADDLVDRRVLLQDLDQLGNPLVGVGHVGVGPHDDLAPGPLGADPAHGARAAVAVEVDHFHLREARRGLVQPGQRVVGGSVVHAHQLVGVAAGLHRRGDALNLRDHVPFLVEARQDDRDVWRGRVSPHERFQYSAITCRLPTVDTEHLGNGVSRRTEDYVLVDVRFLGHHQIHRTVTKPSQAAAWAR